MTDRVPEFIELAHRLADRAGDVVRGHFRAPVPVDIKPDNSPVTLADREAETVMRTMIADAHPDHGVIGEEFGANRADAEWVWVLDPIDGTAGFMTGEPVFGTLIALAHNGKPVIGIIDQPISGERWLGVAGQPSTLNGRPVTTRTCPDLGLATLYTTAPEWFKGADQARYQALKERVRLFRYGADCYAFALMAMGFVDLVIEAGMKAHDFFALIPVIEGAGGIISDWQGRPLTLDSDGKVIAAGDLSLHSKALAFLIAS